VIHSCCMLLMLLGFVQSGATHDDSNPVYKELRNPGFKIEGESIPLPEATLADGLDQAAQESILKTIAEQNGYTLERLMEETPLARHIFKTELATKPVHYRKIDYWFVAFGDYESLKNEETLESLIGQNKSSGSAAEIKPEQLSARGIKIDPKNAEHEGFGIVDTELEKLVALKVTGHAFWSQTEDSVLVATMVDPRFAGDKEFPNQWLPLGRNDRGELTRGDPQPYDGSGLYLKVTPLKGKPRAMFIECHIVMSEPLAWFEGKNNLGAKLPTAIQTQIRNMRTELLKIEKQNKK
jgi:hypothetical protein